MTRVHRPGGLARDPLYFYHLSMKLGVVVLSIPKNACTAQKRWLLGAEGLDDGGDAHKAAFQSMSLLTRQTPVRHWGLATLPMVGFVRDPFLRLASAYRNKLAGKLNLPAATAIEGAAAARGVALVRDRTMPFPGLGEGVLFAACSGVDYERGLSFREFVEYVATTEDLAIDPHWRPQAWFLGPMLMRAKRPNAPETVLAPMDRVAEVLGQIGAAKGVAGPPSKCPETDSLAQAEADLSDVPGGELRGLGRAPLVTELYDESLVERVRERFAADIAVWEQISGGASAGEAILAGRGAAV